MNGSLVRSRAGPRPDVRPWAAAATLVKWAVLLAALAAVFSAALADAAPASARGAAGPDRSATATPITQPYPTMILARPEGTVTSVPPVWLRSAPRRPWPTCVPFVPFRDPRVPRGPYGQPPIPCPVDWVRPAP